ncbi:MAG: bifunctional DNA-formamidopyrimidine glycosylase/DNA-(apurinic or apyrimidinic site) lyase [Chloroflexota bacterium]|nr:bifunctional DNA-formamidopyrimidine glycosylase/DNA-(apurinic or apyrimidinic site) lyase [Chloroflexota bacterium]MDE2946647.1 bifunctional DNA-formamidopyrimidine glycosylase/DNA-(apurinic or apyrimidinic site) lyase [Chloroflexota bacterium]
MPELPEVETVVRGLREALIGRWIEDMWQDWPATIHSPAPDEFAARVSGQRVRALNRRGKYILIALDFDTLVIHLKMSGRLYVTNTDEEHEADRWVHVRFDLDNGQQLRFSDLRKFGRVYLTDDVGSLLGHLGPEPLSDEFTLAVFRAGMKGRRRAIKSLLMEQEFIAGIGNIYADEALFRASIHPATPVHLLTDKDSQRLHQTIRDALRAGIEHEGASINWYRKPDGGKGESQDYFYVYGRANLPCRRCGAVINKIRVGQRGTHFCPQCQPERA